MNMNETLDSANHAATSRSFGEAITVCFSKYATFTGRASRSEFWWFNLFWLLMSWGASVTGAITGGPEIGDFASSVVSLAFIIPGLAVGARRLHDINRSGWWQLLEITIIGILVLIYWWAQEGNLEKNEY